jgi:hypothetical protein
MLDQSVYLVGYSASNLMGSANCRGLILKRKVKYGQTTKETPKDVDLRTAQAPEAQSPR